MCYTWLVYEIYYVHGYNGIIYVFLGKIPGFSARYNLIGSMPGSHITLKYNVTVHTLYVQISTVLYLLALNSFSQFH